MGWVLRLWLIGLAMLVLPLQVQAAGHGGDCHGHAAAAPVAIVALAVAGAEVDAAAAAAGAEAPGAEPHRGVCRSCSACCTVTAPPPAVQLPSLERSPLPGPHELHTPAPQHRASRLERPPRAPHTR